MTANQISDDNSGRSKKLNRFIAKTYLIVNSDEPTACWVHGGKSFVILDPNKFSEIVLPKYFKHNKLTSFVRQLNFYGFHKIRIDPNALVSKENLHIDGANGKEEIASRRIICFQHKFFQANQPKLLHNIQRATKQISPTVDPELLLPEHLKEMDDIQNQLRETKERTKLLSDEFEKKLAAAKAELETDYLHRIKALEVCYKDLFMMILKTREPIPFAFPDPSKALIESVVTSSNCFPPSSHNINSMSICGSNRSLVGLKYDPRDHMVERKRDRESPVLQDNRRQKVILGDTPKWSNKTIEDSPAWLQLNHCLSKGQQIPFSKTVKSGVTTNRDTRF